MELEEIQNLFLNSLLQSGSKLTDFRQGSVVYTLSRAVAAVGLSQYRLLEEYKNNNTITKASGEYLNDLANSFGLVRGAGNIATGSVLGYTFDKVEKLNAGAILTNLDTGLQYRTEEEKTLNSYTETKIQVRAMGIGEEYNLPAGVALYNISNKNIAFVVGSNRKPSSEIIGSISGGNSQESDTSLRNRLEKVLLFSNSNSEYKIKAELEKNSFVNWVGFETPLPGFLTIWVTSSINLTSAEFEILYAQADQIRSAGILISVRQATSLYIDFFIKATGTTPEEVRAALEAYLIQMPISSNLTLNLVSGYIKQVTNADYVSITAPTSDILSTVGQVMRIGNLSVSVNV
jgi:hypothetical protein